MLSTDPRGAMQRKLSFDVKLISCSFVLLVMTLACSPKFVIQGETVQIRVVDSNNGKPIANAAMAIRWIGDRDPRDTGKFTTFNSAQDVSDENGFFHIPLFRNRDYALGIYKKGYVCWYNRDNFLKNEGISTNHPEHITTGQILENGMEIRLTPFEENYSHQRHAGFTVLVAAECTDTTSGPFNRAIRSELKLWQERGSSLQIRKPVRQGRIFIRKAPRISTRRPPPGSGRWTHRCHRWCRHHLPKQSAEHYSPR